MLKAAAGGFDALPCPVAYVFYQLCQLNYEATYHSCNVGGSHALETSHQRTPYRPIMLARRLVPHVGSESEGCQRHVRC